MIFESIHIKALYSAADVLAMASHAPFQQLAGDLEA